MPQTRNSNELSIDQLQTILNNDRIRQHLIRTGYIDRQGNVTRKAGDNHQSRRPHTANIRQSQPVSIAIPSRRFLTENSRPRSPDSNSNNRRLKSASTNRSKGTNQSFDSTRVQNILLRRAVSPQILPSNNRCLVTLTYYGPELNIEYDREWFEPDGDEVIIMQQHCGGENYLVFKGYLKPNDMFSFQSRRHMDYPFALAFYLNGVIKDRLSVCCEFRCNNFMRIGGKSCLVAITKVENTRPCRRCRFEQRMKKLMEGLPKPETTVDRRYRQKSIKTRKSTSKSPPARDSSPKKQENGTSSSKSRGPETAKSKRTRNRTPSADSTESDASDSKANLSRVKSSKPKPTRSSRSKASDSGTSSPESPINHIKSPDTNKDRSASSKLVDFDASDSKPTGSSDTNQDRSSNTKKPDSDVSNSKPIASHVRSSGTKKIRPPSPEEIDSDVSNTEPAESYIRSEPNEVRFSSPKQVDSVPSSPEPMVSPKNFSSKNKDRLPSPQEVDSDTSDSKPPAASHTNSPQTNEPAANSSNTYNPESENIPILNSPRKKSNEDLPLDSSTNNLKKQPPAFPVEVETTTDESNSDFGQYLSAFNRRNQIDD